MLRAPCQDGYPAVLIGFRFVVQLLSFGAVANVQSGGTAYLSHQGHCLWAVSARLFEDPRRRLARRGVV
jgi:hypothetical protein